MDSPRLMTYKTFHSGLPNFCVILLCKPDIVEIYDFQHQIYPTSNDLVVGKFSYQVCPNAAYDISNSDMSSLGGKVQ